jgi:NADPH-dependent 2,4-dienoyl-CoA reductase/sulfur reductase-like enzyme/rhodanese-related sulfurtransferase/nitrogen-specific signal transduction histidine kinase
MKDPEFDITRMSTQVEEYKREVERLVKERNEYLIVSAHQMKSPLLTIIFSINTLLGEYAGKLNSKQLGIVTSIKRSAETLQNLIADIIELEKLRSGKIEFESIDLVSISILAIDELRDKIKEKDIRFDVSLPDKQVVIKGNRLGIKQVILNLLENAVKYSNRNGEVSYSLGYDESKHTVTGVVKDRGIGIPKEEQAEIFKEFYRAQNARRFDATGTGFGMTIVKQVLDLCGGDIKITSKEAKGSRFTFKLPLESVKNRETVLDNSSEKRRKIVIVGGSTAGPKAASRAKRIDPRADVTILEKGHYLSYAGCALPYYISGHLKTQRELSEAISGSLGGPEYFRSVKGINIKTLSEVIAIDRKKKTVKYRDLMTNQEAELGYDSLILATGSNPVVPETVGVGLKNIFTLHGANDSEQIKTALVNEMPKDIVILGGGLIGVETAEALTVSGAKVTIVEKRDQILPFLDPELSSLVERHMVLKGIRIIKEESVSAFIGKEQVEYVQLKNYRLPAQLVILAMGINPNVGLAVKAGLNRGQTGAIAVNEYLQTSDPSIYAAGDCAETWHALLKKPFYLPLGSVANRMGRIAGENAAGQLNKKFSPVTGTMIIKVFDYHVAKTGLNEKEARKADCDVLSSHVPEYDKEPFIPGAEIISIKMTACRKRKQLIGVQIVGKGDVAKRIDIAAMVISKGGNVDDILAVDLGYAPVYSNAVDAIIVAANVLQNKLDGVFEGISPGEVQALIRQCPDECVFLDVRTPQEFEEARIPGFDLIPIENIRSRIDEILPNRRVVLVSQSGARAYQASLILKSLGFTDVAILEGGLYMWPYAVTRG